MEKMKLKINHVEEGTTKSGKKIYKAFLEGSNQYYSCWTDRIKDYVGKEQEFDVEKTEMQGQNGPWFAYTIKLEPRAGESGGFNKSYKTYGKSKDEMVLTAKTMVLSYCKDITVAIINKQQGADIRYWDLVKTGFREIIPLLDLDKLPEAPKQPVPAQPAPVSTLRQPLINLLKMSMNNLKFRAQDMVEYAAERGVELKFDVANDEVVWTCSEHDATQLINAMASDKIPF